MTITAPSDSKLQAEAVDNDNEVQLLEKIPSLGLQSAQLSAEFDLEKTREKWLRKRRKAEDSTDTHIAQPAMQTVRLT